MRELFHIIETNTDITVLKFSPDINCVNMYGENLFAYACKLKHLNACAFILDNEHFNIDITDVHGFTPLMLCIVYEYFDLFRNICRREPDYERCNIYGNNALFIACKYNREVFVKYLLECSADINQVNTHGDTALHIALSVNNLKIVKLLCDYNATPFFKNIVGKNAIDIAIEAGYIGILNTLVFNAIFESIEYGNETLLKYIASIPCVHFNIRHRGKTPLSLSCQQGRLSFVKIIIEKMIFENIILNDEYAVYNALINNHTDIIEYLRNYVNLGVGIRDLYYSSLPNKFEIIEHELPKIMFPHELSNDVFDGDGAIHEEPHTSRHLYRRFCIDGNMYIYDLMFLLKYWDFQYNGKCFTKEFRSEILYNFPIHTGTFFTINDIDKILNKITNVDWIVAKSGLVIDIRPSSPGLNKMPNVPIYGITCESLNHNFDTE